MFHSQTSYPWVTDARVHRGFYNAYVNSFKDKVSVGVTVCLMSEHRITLVSVLWLMLAGSVMCYIHFAVPGYSFLLWPQFL